MDTFLQLLCLMGQLSGEDLISQLPVEMSSGIFRYLDQKSLLQASAVCKRWNDICKGDIVLRRRIRKQLVKERQERIQTYLEPSRSVQITRELPGNALGRRNGPAGVEVKNQKVEYELPKAYRRPEARKFKVGEDVKKKCLKSTIAKKRKAECFENNLPKKKLRM